MNGISSITQWASGDKVAQRVGHRAQLKAVKVSVRQRELATLAKLPDKFTIDDVMKAIGKNRNISAKLVQTLVGKGDIAFVEYGYWHKKIYRKTNG